MSQLPPAPHPLQLGLRVVNDPRVLRGVEAFLREALALAGLDPAKSDAFLCLALASTHEAVAHAYAPGQTGPITLDLTLDDDRMTFVLGDEGLPRDASALEAALHSPDATLRTGVLGRDWHSAADEVHWSGLGPAGNALKMMIWRHDSRVDAHVAEAGLQPFEEAPPLAPEQEYVVRGMSQEEAVQVSQLIYRAYGRTYCHPDVYFPERMAAMNRSGALVSFVAVDASGQVVGHYALERTPGSPVAELGQAVVNPSHRGRGLLRLMKDAAVAAARTTGLAAVYAEAVTVHTFTQKDNLSHGAVLTCADLGIVPGSLDFVAIPEGHQFQRVTCLLYWLPLEPTPAHPLFVPPRHQEAVSKIYHGMKRDCHFGSPAKPSGSGEIEVKFMAPYGTAFLRSLRNGTDTVATLRHSKRHLVEHSRAEAVFVDLPLADDATPEIAEGLEAEGFSFAGVAPCFSKDGDLLRLVYLTESLSPDKIKLEGDFARWLVGYALGERHRVDSLT